MKHVIVLDEDEAERRRLHDYLSQYAFRVTGVCDMSRLFRVISSEIVDAFVINLNLEPGNGVEVVRRLTAVSDAPIIMISQEPVEEVDMVVGLELGATDYIIEPFSLRLFLARLRVATRHKASLKIERDRRSFIFGEWSLSVRQRVLQSKTHSVKLTAAEFSLLVAFLSMPRQALSREQLLVATRMHSQEIFDRSVDALVLRLRRKLEADPSRPLYIKTERGVGYIFESDVEIVERPRLRRA